MAEIIFIVASRYPTEKAFGVTIGRTALELRKLGKDILIVSPETENREIDLFQNSVREFTLNRFSRGIFSLGRKSVIGNVSWQLLFGILIGNKYKKTSSAICLREVYITLISSLINHSNIHLLEIHHLPKGMKRIVILLLTKKRNVRIAFLSEDLFFRSGVKIEEENSFIIPMGVPSEFLVEEKKLRSRGETLRLCFVGKAMSNGVDNGLVQFTSLLSKAHLGFQIKMTFVGIENSRIERQIINSLRNNQGISLEFYEHLPHNRIPEVLKENDVGVIPYPDNPYHRDRFPIKSLEYAASRTLILASDTGGNRAVIPSKCCLFYSPQDESSLENQLSSYWDLDKTEETLTNASNWAKLNTYEGRARMYVQALSMMGRR